LDASQALRDAENALRDLISVTLESSFGQDWISKCGVTAERIDKWKQRKAEEIKRQDGITAEERILYYSDFYDLAVILKKHWNLFSAVFGDWRRIEIYLDDLGQLRNSDAHRRELLPHQARLAEGVAGEIRTRIIRYRSKMETAQDCFPRIECVRDNLGHIWTPQSATSSGGNLFTNTILRSGDVLNLIVTASDPLGEALQYQFALQHLRQGKWQDSHEYTYTIAESDIGKNFSVNISVRSLRPYHAHTSWDDNVDFFYDVLPTKK